MSKLGCMERFLGLKQNLTKRYRAELWKNKEIYENCDRTTLIRKLLAQDLLLLELDEKLEKEGKQ